LLVSPVFWPVCPLAELLDHSPTPFTCASKTKQPFSGIHRVVVKVRFLTFFLEIESYEFIPKLTKKQIYDQWIAKNYFKGDKSIFAFTGNIL
jgi:hypothetical protein